jgi:two-component system phosphate regulon sensor histidine kinase PhoR
MNRLRTGILPVLLVVTILVITGFQLFWLKQNYDNEKRTLEVKAGFNFRESIYNLQAAHLSQRFGLPGSDKDSFQMEIHEGDRLHDKLTRFNKTREVVSIINTMRKNEMDSLTAMNNNHKTTVAIYSNDGPRVLYDSTGATWNEEKSNVRFIKLLDGIDSVADTLKMADINTTTALLFAKEKINVPFTIIKTVPSIALKKDSADAG